MANERERRWFAIHKIALGRLYPGQWVVIDGEKLVASNHSLSEVVREATKRGVAIPCVFRVEGTSTKEGAAEKE